MKLKKISFIIPVFNTEEYVKKCIESVIDQTYKNIEIIVIDDGSTDDSLKICNEIGVKDNRIYIYKEWRIVLCKKLWNKESIRRLPILFR